MVGLLADGWMINLTVLLNKKHISHFMDIRVPQTPKCIQDIVLHRKADGHSFSLSFSLLQMTGPGKWAERLLKSAGTVKARTPKWLACQRHGIFFQHIIIMLLPSN